MSGWKVENSNSWTMIGKQDPQKPQMFYPINNPGLTLTKGDTVAARCTMVNHRDRKVGHGYFPDRKVDQNCTMIGTSINQIALLWEPASSINYIRTGSTTQN